MTSFENNIKNWVLLDNKIKQHNEEIKKIREEKNKLTENINVYVEENNLQKAVVNISDGRLKFTTTKVSKPLSIKFLKDTLENYKHHKNIDLPVDDIIDFIKSQREFKYVEEIKRFYN